MCGVYFSFMNNRTKIVSWALYDAANTIFATNVVSLYFPLWVTVQKGASDNWYILAYYFSIVLAVFILPFFGILSDKLRKYSFFLRIFTLVCITFTASIGLFDNLLAGVVFFVVANLFNQVAANTFYPALLAEVSPADKIPFVSGLGVGLGYIGTIVGLSFARLFVKEANYQNVFLPTASLFLLFSLPCFLFVKDARKEMKMRDSISIIREHLRNFLAAFRTLITNRMLLKFFCSILLMINGVNGVL